MPLEKEPGGRMDDDEFEVEEVQEYEESTIIYDTDGEQHVEVKDE